MKKEFQALREKIERLMADIEKITNRFVAKNEALWKTVANYGTKRVELFLKKLHAQKKTWCTLCVKNYDFSSAVHPEAEIKLLLIKDKHMSGGTSHYDSPEPVFYSNLHRVCPECYKKALDRHGIRRDKCFFYAFQVEQREDGYYAREFGEWVKLDNDDKDCQFPEFPDSLIEKLADKFSKEFKLPPKIEIKSGELVIHE